MKYFFYFLILLFTQISFAFDATLKPVNVIMPFPPGGGVDQTFRHFEKYLTTKNIHTIPIYKPGGNGLVSGNELVNSTPDGYTIYIGTTATIAEFKAKNLDKNVIPISIIRTTVMSMVSSKFKTYVEFENAVKSNQKILFGFNSPDQVFLFKEILNRISQNYTPEFVPYKGAPMMLQDLSGNIIDVGLAPFTVTKAFIDSKKLNLIAHDNLSAIENYNGISLFQYYKNWQKTGGFILILNSNTPSEQVNFWTKIVYEYVNDKSVLVDFKNQYSSPPITFGKDFANEQIKIDLDRLPK